MHLCFVVMVTTLLLLPFFLLVLCYVVSWSRASYYTVGLHLSEQLGPRGVWIIEMFRKLNAIENKGSWSSNSLYLHVLLLNLSIRLVN